jgi:acyl carrier protein phosphodiesterase
MNYLVHLYLAGSNEESIIGNFIADHVKGSHWKNYSEGIQAGILMHRAVDDFTDHHSVVLESKKIFSPQFGLASGILVDIFYDHLFAKEWIDKNGRIHLNQYASEIYSILKSHESLLPERSRRFLGYMIEYNILYQYHTLQGIEQTLRGLSRRLKDRFQLWDGLQVFEEQESLIHQQYQIFFQNLNLKFKKI